MLLLGACASPPLALSCAAPLKPAVEVDLSFGRNIDGGGQVSDTDWASFLAAEVTPRFPDGLSVIDVAGQYRLSGEITRERSKLVVVVVFDAPAHVERVRAIVETYKARFHQHMVFHTEHAVCAG